MTCPNTTLISKYIAKININKKALVLPKPFYLFPCLVHANLIKIFNNNRVRYSYLNGALLTHKSSRSKVPSIILIILGLTLTYQIHKKRKGGRDLFGFIQCVNINTLVVTYQVSYRRRLASYNISSPTNTHKAYVRKLGTFY